MTRAERGQALVELALTLPILLWALFAVIDMGIAFGRSVELTNAAREAMRYATLYPTRADGAASADPDNAKYVLKRHAYGMELSDASITVRYETQTVPPATYDATVPANAQYAVSGNGMRVSVTYAYVPIAPFLNVLFPNGSVALNATSVGRIE